MMLRSFKPRNRRAFSLVEMVIVIGIIVLLVGLTVAVLTSLTRASEVRSTENVLKILDSTLSEWELSAERQMTMGTNGQPQPGLAYDLQLDYPGDPLGSAERQTSIMLTRMASSLSCRQMLANINSEFLVRQPDPVDPTQTIVRVLDPWGKDIVLVHPGRMWLPADGPTLGPDNDGTIHTPVNLGGVPLDISEARLGAACANRRICFMSAGADGRFGHLEAGSTQAQHDQARDNIYSYPLEAP